MKNTISILYCCIVCTLLTAKITFALTVQPQHPRIWLSPAKKEQIIIQCSEDGEFRDYYLRVKDYVDNEGSEKVGHVGQHQSYFISLLLCAMVDGGEYITRVQDHIQNWYDNRQAYRYSDIRMGGISLCYDWLFDRLTPQDKTRVAEVLKTWWGYWNSSSAYIHGSWNNHTMEEIQGWVFGSLALYGDGYADTEAADNLLTARQWLYDEIIQATNLGAGALSASGEDGGWDEGSYYWTRGGYALLGNLYAWTTATDEDALSESVAGKTFGKWLFHIARNDNTLARFGDGYAYTLELHSGFSFMFYMLSDLYNDGYARYRWNTYAPPDGILSPSTSVLSRSYAPLYSFYILFNNSTVPVNVNEQPEVMYFDSGIVTIRKSFEDGDTFFLYKHNDVMAGHDHRDAGHFEIARDVGLAVDSGAYEGGDNSPNNHATKYYHRTIAHNAITVYDPNEIWDHYYDRFFTTNDGGQKWTGPANGSGHPHRYIHMSEDNSYDTGSITNFETNSYATYIKSDLSPAYALGSSSRDLSVTNSGKMDRYTREIVYAAEKYFVIFDLVRVTDASFAKRWLLHFANEPLVSNSSVRAENGNSALLVESLLPQDAIIVKRGGTGYEYWTNYDETGENPEVSSHYTRPPNEPGGWRIEVSPPGKTLSDTFMHVLMPGPLSITMADIDRITGNNIHGVVIKDSPENQVVIFKAGLEEQPLSSVTYSMTPTEPSRHFIHGLEPDRRYAIRISGSNREPVTTSENGILTFTDHSVGPRSYELSRMEKTAPGAPTNLTLQQ